MESNSKLARTCSWILFTIVLLYFSIVGTSCLNKTSKYVPFKGGVLTVLNDSICIVSYRHGLLHLNSYVNYTKRNQYYFFDFQKSNFFTTNKVAYMPVLDTLSDTIKITLKGNNDEPICYYPVRAKKTGSSDDNNEWDEFETDKYGLLYLPNIYEDIVFIDVFALEYRDTSLHLVSSNLYHDITVTLGYRNSNKVNIDKIKIRKDYTSFIKRRYYMRQKNYERIKKSYFSRCE